MLQTTFYVIIVALIASSGGLLFGYDLVSILTGWWPSWHVGRMTEDLGLLVCRVWLHLCLLSASWRLTPSLQGLQGVTGGVEAMPDFLEKFFPDVYAAQQTKSVDPYCSFESQKLSAFTSTLFLSGEAAKFWPLHAVAVGVVSC